MARFLLRTVGFVQTLVSIAVAQGPTETSPRVLGWRADIDSLVSAARAVHAAPARPAHGRAFAEAATRLKAAIPTLPDHRVAVEIQRLVAMLGDGHSLVYPVPGRAASFRTLPVEVYLFEDGLYVVGGIDSARELVGSRVERFGDLPTSEILTRMAPYVSRDNAMGLKAFASLYLVLPEFLAAWGATTDLQRVTLTLTDTLGRSRIVRLEAGPPRRVRRRLHPPPFGPRPVPLYLRDADRSFWIARLADQQALYCQFNRVADGPDGRIADLARRLADSLEAHGASRLVFDVRHNIGGNNQLLAPLVQGLTSFAQADTANRIYVLTGRATFSAAQNFINRIEQAVPHVIFAGEPSMSSPNFTGEDNPVRLPYSGLVVSISNRHWQDSGPDDRRPWIAPHLPVALRSTDWRQNRDPVLEAVTRDMEARARR